MHEQVTMLQKLLSHISEQYADVQDEGYISDEDIEEYPETFMPRPRIMSMNVQEPVQPQQPQVAQVQPHHNTKQRLEQGLHQIRRVLFPSEIELEEFKNTSNLIKRLAQTDAKTKPYLSKSCDPCLLKPM